jgi:hypothetical protein
MTTLPPPLPPEDAAVELVFPEEDDELPFDPTQPHGAARAERLLLVRPDAVLPDRCVRCNQPAAGFKRIETFYWVSPILLVLAISPVIFLIVYMIVRRKIVVGVPVCARHRKLRTRAILAASTMSALAIGGGVTAIALENGYLALPAIVLLIAGILTGILGSRTLVTTKITKEGIGSFKTCCPAFLGSFKEAGYKLDGTRIPPL